MYQTHILNRPSWPPIEVYVEVGFEDHDCSYIRSYGAWLESENDRSDAYNLTLSEAELEDISNRIQENPETWIQDYSDDYLDY